MLPITQRMLGSLWIFGCLLVLSTVLASERDHARIRSFPFGAGRVEDDLGPNQGHPQHPDSAGILMCVFPCRSAVQRGVWEVELAEEGPSPEGWRLCSDREVKPRIDF